MKKYQWILFDADETLFHFDAFQGLQLALSWYQVTFTWHDYQEYQVKNKALWIDYQSGLITAKELKHQRFIQLSDKVGISTQELNSAFLKAMAEICVPIYGATNLLNALKGRVKLGIITNGFAELQMARLERTGHKEHFEVVIISEEVGVAKPDPRIFDHALTVMGNPEREHVLMVGDTLTSDILGGLNSGLDTCWLNRDNQPLSGEIYPHYQINCLSELEKLLVNMF